MDMESVLNWVPAVLQIIRYNMVRQRLFVDIELHVTLHSSDLIKR